MKIMKLNLRGCERSYEIRIDHDLMKQICPILVNMNIANRYVLITDSTVARLYGKELCNNLNGEGIRGDMVEFPAGEASKTIDTVLSLVRKLLQLGVDRTSALIALGGGVVGDIVGFVASIYMRSLPYIQIPTTLVAQVDSSIGGKTAVDLQEGKNLLGTFYQPQAVLIDPLFLDTLPESEFGNGMAEIVKYGVIDRSGLFPLLDEGMTSLRQRHRETLNTVIKSSCAIKKQLVEIDEFDQGPRHYLNFGHTLGHALEAASAYGLSHGNGVAIGMIAATRLSEKMIGLSHAQRLQVEDLIARAGLPTRIPSALSTESIMEKVKADKKKSGSKIHFVLLKAIGQPVVTSDVTEDDLLETIEKLKI